MPISQMDRVGRKDQWVQGPVPPAAFHQRKHKKITEKAKKRVDHLKKTEATPRPVEEYLREVGDKVITFEHLNVNGINAQGDLLELEHILRVFKEMEAGVISINEHTLDTNLKLITLFIV